MPDKKFVTDKAMGAKVQSQYRTFSLYALQQRKTETPFNFNSDYNRVKNDRDMIMKIHEASGLKNISYDIVKCLVTITHREIDENEYHWTDHLEENSDLKL